MRIVTLNIRHGGGARSGEILSFVTKLNSDVVLFTEFRENNTGTLLKSQVFDAGYKWQSSNSPDPKTNGVFIGSRLPFVIDSTDEGLDLHAHRLLFARFDDLNLVGVYFPQNEAKRSVFARLSTHIVPKLGDLGVVIGDFNTGAPYLDEAGKTFACSECFSALLNDGLIDSWRSRNPAGKEFSWLSAKRNGFRVDHVLCTPNLDKGISTVRYLHETRELKISDHSALLVDYQPTPTH
jgi:exodeoxyribonuclease III